MSNVSLELTVDERSLILIKGNFVGMRSSDSNVCWENGGEGEFFEEFSAKNSSDLQLPILKSPMKMMGEIDKFACEKCLTNYEIKYGVKNE